MHGNCRVGTATCGRVLFDGSEWGSLCLCGAPMYRQRGVAMQAPRVWVRKEENEWAAAEDVARTDDVWTRRQQQRASREQAGQTGLLTEQQGTASQEVGEGTGMPNHVLCLSCGMCSRVPSVANGRFGCPGAALHQQSSAACVFCVALAELGLVHCSAAPTPVAGGPGAAGLPASRRLTGVA
jgi:hypothetical protein